MTFVLLTAFFSYVKVCAAGMFNRISGSSGLLWCGCFTQIGSLVGAVVAFLLVNVGEAGFHWPADRLHDLEHWFGDVVHGGFAEPVMDMERIVLTFSNASALLDELRGLGRNLSSARFPGMRGRGWRQRLEQAIEQHGARAEDGRLRLTFEIIYGHAFKSEPRRPRGDSQSVSVDDMRAMLRGRKP